MEVKSIVAYEGPNIHAHFPVIRYTVDLGVLEEWPTGRLGQHFIDGLLDYLPGLAQHGCSYQSPGGLVRRMTEGDGTWLGHLMEHAAIELQKMAGSDVSFGKTRAAGPHGHYDVIYEYHDKAVGRQAGDLALALIEHLLPAELKPQTDTETQFDFEQKLDDFRRDARSREVGPSTAALMKAAADRAIPCTRMNADSPIRLGYGRFQKRIKATLTSKTRQLAVDIASDKEETNRTLRDAGLPVPRQRKVYRACDAVVSAEQLGYPVVVKPLDCNHGRGVSIKLTTPEQVELAFKRARKYSHVVLVENYIPGSDYRMLVVNDQLVAVAKRVPAHVVGDGLHTVEQLVEEANRDPRRGVGHENVLTRIELDDTAHSVLGAAGCDFETVPARGETVYLCATANLSTGGTSIDVTDQVHPDNRPGGPARRRSTEDRFADGSGRSPRRGHSGDRAHCGRALRPIHLPSGQRLARGRSPGGAGHVARSTAQRGCPAAANQGRRGGANGQSVSARDGVSWRFASVAQRRLREGMGTDRAIQAGDAARAGNQQ